MVILAKLVFVANLVVLIAFFGTMPLFIKIQGAFNYYCDYTGSLFENNETPQVYDFIVVGSGSAGAVLANRLSKNNKVLVLEAGGNPLFYNYIPMLANAMFGRPEVDWLYKTEPQKFSGGSFVNRQFPWPRGKLVGGTSNMNYQVYMRGNPNCYDNWANMTGDPTWKYDNVLPYFKKSLDYHGEFEKNTEHYGQSAYGFLHVENRKWVPPLHQTFLDAGKELGYGEVDVNGPQRVGFGPIEVTQKNGERFGTFSGFIQNNLGSKSNLVISRYSHATKLKLDKSGRAVGVWYERHGVKKFASARKEIIVSGGAIGSPQLLMLSGIGPKKHLESIGIKVKVDLPVGQNLRDHPTVMVTPISIDKKLSFIPERDLGISTLSDYFMKGSGPLTMPLLVHSVGYMATSYATREWPDLQIYISSVGIYENIEADFANELGYDEAILKKYFGPVKVPGGRDGMILFPVLNRPKSVGQITLKDKNPYTHPAMDPRYLEHPQDVAALVEGIKFCLKLAENTTAFQSVGAKFLDVRLPGCESHVYRSDAYFECYVRHFSMHVWHPVGTCKMGKGRSDRTAVVDSKLRVLGVPGLRVVDASIMPEIVNGNTNAPAIMIGEKGADFIREYWTAQYKVCDAWEHALNRDKLKSYYSNFA